MRTASTNLSSYLRYLPSVDELLRSKTARQAIDLAGAAHATGLARQVIDDLREELRSGSRKTPYSKGDLLELAASRLENAWDAEQKTSIQRVINATGVIIHTNLGRAPLSDAARRAVADEAAAYCSLEYDLGTGKRGKRGGHTESLLAELTGAEAVLIVNNCAAAAFFVLTVFAAGGEVVISRGELVEIGGDFRVPDVLAQSGALLHEVGTTNRTKLADYQRAINKKTRLILRVHPSNYRIVGFTAAPTLNEMADLAHHNGLILYEDLGSGALIDLDEFGIVNEPMILSSLEAGADIVTFSGDKLLGGPQAGIIAGRRELIEKLRSHPLNRALRPGKLVYAALEATLDAYRRSLASEVPVLAMLSMTKEEIAARVSRFRQELDKRLGSNSSLQVKAVEGVSTVGGGAAPEARLETVLVAISHQTMPTVRLEQLLRDSVPPVIARIADDRVMIDLRTVSNVDEGHLIEAIARMC